MNLNYSKRFVVIAVLFVVCLITSNFFVPRLWHVVGDLHLTAAVLIFPISYILNDCITEVYGFKKAQFIIWMGFGLSAFVAIASALACSLPLPLNGTDGTAQSFNKVFGQVPITVIGSLAAFLVGSTVNAFIVSKMKVTTKGKGFGWRAILSTIGGETIDSAIFFPIAFGGVVASGGMTWGSLGLMALTQILVKTGYEVIILPVTTLVVKHLKKVEGIDTYDTDEKYNPFKI